MKYLDEKGLKHLWSKIQEISSGGTGDGVTYFENEYTALEIRTTNPYWYLAAPDLEEGIGEQDKAALELIKKYALVNSGEKLRLIEDGTDTGVYIVQEATTQELMILKQALLTIEESFAYMQFESAVYVSRNATNFFEALIAEQPFDATFLIARAYLNLGDIPIPFYMMFYANLFTENLETHWKIKRTEKIPVKTLLNKEPVMLWNGYSDLEESITITTNDSIDKFKFIILVYQDSKNAIKTSLSIPDLYSENVLIFDLNADVNGEYVSDNIIGQVTYPSTVELSTGKNIGSEINVVALVGVY